MKLKSIFNASLGISIEMLYAALIMLAAFSLCIILNLK